MNILILNWRDLHHPKAGGAEHVTYEHAKRWVQKGHGVVWFSTAFPGGSFEESLDGIRIIRKGSDISVFFYAAWYVLSNRKKIDCIVDEVHGIPFFSVLYSRTPIIVFIHEIAGRIWEYMYPFPFATLGKVLEEVYLRLYRSRKFWTVSRSTAVELKNRGVLHDQISVIPNPIGCTPVRTMPKKESHPTFLYVGRLVKMKRISEIISAFALVQKQRNDAMLWIVGSGSEHYIQTLQVQIRSYCLEDHVRFFGRVDEKRKLQLMRKAHILLHTSAKEGWGLVVLEAASQGTPSIVYDVAGLKDAVVHNKTGIVVSESDTKAMAQCALSLLSDTKRYRTLQQNGHTRSQKSNWDSVASESEAMLTRVVEGYR